MRETLLRTARRQSRKQWAHVLVEVAVMVLLGVALTRVDEIAGDTVTGVVQVVAGIALVIAFFAFVFTLVSTRPAARRKASEQLLAEYPWQEVRGTVAHVVLPDGRAGRFLTLHHLDAPHPTALFAAPWPEQEVPDPGGAATFWFAGDARFGGVVTLPDGTKPTAVTCTPVAPVEAYAAADRLALAAGLTVRRPNRRTRAIARRFGRNRRR